MILDSYWTSGDGGTTHFKPVLSPKMEGMLLALLVEPEHPAEQMLADYGDFPSSNRGAGPTYSEISGSEGPDDGHFA